MIFIGSYFPTFSLISGLFRKMIKTMLETEFGIICRKCCGTLSFAEKPMSKNSMFHTRALARAHTRTRPRASRFLLNIIYLRYIIFNYIYIYILVNTRIYINIKYFILIIFLTKTPNIYTYGIYIRGLGLKRLTRARARARESKYSTQQNYIPTENMDVKIHEKCQWSKWNVRFAHNEHLASRPRCSCNRKMDFIVFQQQNSCYTFGDFDVQL